MTAYEDVLRWAEDRPWWQQKVLARIAGGEAIAEREHVEIARSLKVIQGVVLKEYSASAAVMVCSNVSRGRR